MENCFCNIKRINVITSKQNFLLELIDKIPYPNIQRKYFKKYLEFQKLDKEHKSKSTNQYNLKIVLEQFSKPKPIGIQDLQNEISPIKLQINTMISQNQEIEKQTSNLRK